MKIVITSGTGKGDTELAALDAALLKAGIGNYNLVFLSSIIPPNSQLIKTTFSASKDEYGNRLYVVIAKKCTSEPGRSAWAGLGWIQDINSGKGFFAEHNGTNRNTVENIITASLQTMAVNRDVLKYNTDLKIVGIECMSKPVCAVVAAVFKNEAW